MVKQALLALRGFRASKDRLGRKDHKGVEACKATRVYKALSG